MKIENTGDSFELGFDIPEPGVHIWQILEGIEKRVNESGKTTLQIPLEIDSVVSEGAAANIGMKCSHFVPIETSFGERQLNGLLSICQDRKSKKSLIDAFAKKFSGDIDPLSDEFLGALKLKLPGNFVKATHTIQKYQEKKQVNFTKFEKSDSGSATGPVTESLTPPSDQGDDW